jgi:glutamyl/glutaminyl-tRNA synthetase
MTEADRRTLGARLAVLRQSPWRTRFAPAPTGHLHLGHAVNAVYVWSIARAFGGSVVVRIEDHDQTRSRPVFEHSILSDLQWLGLDADNVSCGFPMPLRQSTRHDAYVSALSSLSTRGLTFRCRCSRRNIHEATGGAEGRYPGTCRAANVGETETVATRLTIDEGVASFDDFRHGVQEQHPAAQCGDLLLRDRLGQWTYQFAVVVDDRAQQIDVIIRGDDLLDSTGRQLLLAQHLGRDAPPLHLHHPLVTHADGSKLSKSNRDTALHELRNAGWSPASVLGHAAWLGGLQPTSAPIDASALAALWMRDE